MNKNVSLDYIVTLSLKVETTGPQPEKDKIKAIAALPVYLSYERDRMRIPFYINFTKGLTLAYGRECFEQWWTRLDGHRKNNIICFDHRIDYVFFRYWLGDDAFFDYFNDTGMDVLSVVKYLNERAILQGEDRPFLNLSLTSVCNALDIQRPARSDVLIEADLSMEVYRKLLFIMPIAENTYWRSLKSRKEKQLIELKEKYKKEDENDLRA